jgi:hypothetical protein
MTTEIINQKYQDEETLIEYETRAALMVIKQYGGEFNERTYSLIRNAPKMRDTLIVLLNNVKMSDSMQQLIVDSIK